MQKKKNNAKKRKKTIPQKMSNCSDYQSYLDTVETTTTDYWISTKQTPHVTPQQYIRNPIQNDQVLNLPTNSNIISRKNTFPEDMTTPEYEIDPESQVIWSLDD